MKNCLERYGAKAAFLLEAIGLVLMFYFLTKWQLAIHMNTFIPPSKKLALRHRVKDHRAGFKGAILGVFLGGVATGLVIWLLGFSGWQMSLPVLTAIVGYLVRIPDLDTPPLTSDPPHVLW